MKALPRFPSNVATPQAAGRAQVTLSSPPGFCSASLPRLARVYVRSHACADGGRRALRAPLCARARSRPAFRVLITLRALVGGGGDGDMATVLVVFLGLALLGTESGCRAGKDWAGRTRVQPRRSLWRGSLWRGWRGYYPGAPGAAVPGVSSHPRGSSPKYCVGKPRHGRLGGSDEILEVKSQVFGALGKGRWSGSGLALVRVPGERIWRRPPTLALRRTIRLGPTAFPMDGSPGAWGNSLRVGLSPAPAGPGCTGTRGAAEGLLGSSGPFALIWKGGFSPQVDAGRKCT